MHFCRTVNIYQFNQRLTLLSLMECLHDPANVQQTSSKCIQNTGANAGRLLDRVDTVTYFIVLL